MIVPMKKVTLLCLEQDREATLHALRDLGVLHVAPAQPPTGEDLTRLHQAADRAAQAVAAIDAAAGSTGGNDAPPSASEPSAEQIIEDVHALLAAKKEMQDERERLLRLESAYAPYGDFDPDSARTLAGHGVTVRLYRIPKRQALTAPEGVMVMNLGEDGGNRCIATIGPEDVTLDAEEVPLPEQSLSAVRAALGTLAKQDADLAARVAALAAARDRLAAYTDELRAAIRMVETRESMGRRDRIVYLAGYCPAPRLPELRAALPVHGWGLSVGDPAPDENVPTLIHYPRWVRPIKAVLDILGILPGYDEVDVSAAFLVFFSLFFGMLVGDAGYGLIFLGLAFLARWKLPKLPARAFTLLVVTSAATMIWGGLSGTWFGIANLPAPLRGLALPWLSSELHVMELCFLIGAVHLTLAHGWAAWRSRRSLRALAQIGWILSTWMMFFLARWLVLGYDKPGFVWPVVGVAALFIALFMTPPAKFKTEWFGHAMLPLNMISNFVDVVSYVRLFAVGAASLAVAAAFNEMALRGGITGPLSAVVAALILFMGHALNIVMAIMGVMVHGIRLNTLEFSGHIGVEWKGHAYRPFAHDRERAED